MDGFLHDLTWNIHPQLMFVWKIMNQTFEPWSWRSRDLTVKSMFGQKGVILIHWFQSLESFAVTPAQVTDLLSSPALYRKWFSAKPRLLSNCCLARQTQLLLTPIPFQTTDSNSRCLKLVFISNLFDPIELCEVIHHQLFTSTKCFIISFECSWNTKCCQIRNVPSDLWVKTSLLWEIFRVEVKW